jgi:hypothetical protein
MVGDARSDSSSPAPLLCGLARDPAAPVQVLLRLLETWPSQAGEGLRRRRDLPPPVQEAMLRHPAPGVRATLAAHPQVDPQVRGVLVFDPRWGVRMRAFGRAGQRPLTDEVLMRLLADLDDPPPEAPATSMELISELLEGMRWDPRLFRLAATHPRPGVRRLAARNLEVLDRPAQQALLGDLEPDVWQVAAESEAYRQRVMQPADLPAQHCHAFWAAAAAAVPGAVEQVLESGDVDAIGTVAGNPTTPPGVVEALLSHPEPAVRQSLAERPDLNTDQLTRLAADQAVEVPTAVSSHPGLTEQQRDRIDIDVSTVYGDGHFGTNDVSWRWVGWPYGPVPTLDDALRWASSVNPLLRRRAARNPQLPPDVVTALADDPDLGVRVLLAGHHPAAPPALLLRSYLEYHRCGRDRLRDLPQFPTDGLAHFADHPDPTVRQLVARDRHADPALVDRLLNDPNPDVRQAMASSPRLPVPRVIALLDDPELAESAAANPALPAEQIQRILDSTPH